MFNHQNQPETPGFYQNKSEHHLLTAFFTVNSLKTAVLCVLFLLMLLLHAAFIQTNAVYDQASSISDSVLRLRVIANSDTEKDQTLKLAFKSRLCEALKPYLADCGDVDTAADWIQTHLDFIQEQARQILNELSAPVGCSPQNTDCTVQFTKSNFPVRTYGTLTFPPGNYRTLLVTLGNGQGHNWWCVLYPSLCFTDETTAAFPEEARTQLQQTLKQQDYETLNQGITFHFRIAEVLGDLVRR